MATQDGSTGIPVSLAPDQTGFRLLELSPELCELITSDKLSQISLKSAATSTNGTGSRLSTSSTSPSHAVLCTGTQTYQLRQVQTSNTVLLVRSNSARSSDMENDSAGDGLCAVATCTSSLEINPLEITGGMNTKLRTAEQWLIDLLPFHDTDQDADPDVHMVNASHETRTTSKIAIFSDVPYSDGECEMAWRALGAFELNSRSLRPQVKTLLHLWTSVFHSVDITKPFTPTNLQDAVEESSIPLPLFETILKYLASPAPSYSADLDLKTPLQLDKEKTIIWVGEIHHGSNDSPRNSGISSSADLNGWQILLPEAWSSDVTMDKFAELRHNRFKLNKVNGDDTALNAPAKKPGRNRDWHQMLKRPRTK